MITTDTWRSIRRDVFSIMLMCLDGATVKDAISEADELIQALDSGRFVICSHAEIAVSRQGSATCMSCGEQLPNWTAGDSLKDFGNAPR